MDADNTKAIAVVSMISLFTTFVAINCIFRELTYTWSPNFLELSVICLSEAAVNQFLLIGRGIGTRFERKFDRLSYRDKAFIIFYATIYIIVLFLTFALTTPIHAPIVPH
ncbi:hypothetical protein [Sphingomonas oligophenolica]